MFIADRGEMDLMELLAGGTSSRPLRAADLLDDLGMKK
jgi:hypothetical protein